jgi:thioredoxin-like negative regulator of GroEL
MVPAVQDDRTDRQTTGTGLGRQNPNTMMQYGVMGIPTLMLFKSGEIKERMTGYQPKEKLVAKITPHV